MTARELLKDKGIGINWLARATNIPVMTIYDIINEDKMHKTSLDKAKKIADVLGITLDELYNLTK